MNRPLNPLYFVSKHAPAPGWIAVLCVGWMTGFGSMALAADTAPGGAVPPAVKEGEPEAEDKWRLTVGPLEGWLAGVDGSVTAKGTELDVDVPLHDVLDQLDAYYQFYVEARTRQFGFYTQPLYMKLGAENKSQHLDVEAALKTWIVEAGAFYQIVNKDADRPFTVDALAGVRYWNMDTDLSMHATVQGPLGRTRTRVFQGGETTEITDPIVGLRARKYLTPKLHLDLQGDIGGFDISSDTSKFSWQAVGSVGYQFNKRVGAMAGYRALSLDVEDGSGSTESGMDLVIHGAILGVRLTF